VNYQRWPEPIARELKKCKASEVEITPHALKKIGGVKRQKKASSWTSDMMSEKKYYS
jgi:hypothetical protein